MKENFPHNPDFVRLGYPKITIQFDQEEEKILGNLQIFKQKIKEVAKPFCLWFPNPIGFLIFVIYLKI